MRNFENLNTVNIRLKIGAKKRLVVFLPLSIVFAIMGEKSSPLIFQIFLIEQLMRKKLIMKDRWR